MSSGTISGAQVRAARALLGWTVHELAHRSIVSIVTIHEIEESATAAEHSP
jgi:transcriptional regulator with XRE-family HTH domain